MRDFSRTKSMWPEVPPQKMVQRDVQRKQRSVTPWQLWLLGVYGPAAVLLGVIAMVHHLHDVPLGFFFRDPTVTLQGHPLTGLSSNVGAMLWLVTGGICIFSGQLMNCRPVAPFVSKTSIFLSYCGLLTITLAVDDFFLLHDGLLPNLLGINEKAVLLFYVANFSICALKFRHQIVRSRWGLLFSALIFFAASLSIDRYQSQWDSAWRIFFEDGFKLLGIVSWSGYFVQVCSQSLAQILDKKISN